MSKLNNFVLRKIRLLLSFEKKALQVKFNAFSGISKSSTQKIRMFAIDNQTLKHYEPLPNYIYSRHI